MILKRFLYLILFIISINVCFASNSLQLLEIDEDLEAYIGQSYEICLEMYNIGGRDLNIIYFVDSNHTNYVNFTKQKALISQNTNIDNVAVECFELTIPRNETGNNASVRVKIMNQDEEAYYDINIGLKEKTIILNLWWIIGCTCVLFVIIFMIYNRLTKK